MKCGKWRSATGSGRLASRTLIRLIACGSGTENGAAAIFQAINPARMFIHEMYGPLLQQIRAKDHGAVREIGPTGWTKVDRGIDEAGNRLAAAGNEEQYQLLCRETLISLAQTVFDPELHPPLDETPVSTTDAKRMLDAYIAHTLGGDSHEKSRRDARAAFELTNELQHKRTATFREAALCAEATTSVINLIAIISGRRDP
jgi:hypothetical protein